MGMKHIKNIIAYDEETLTWLQETKIKVFIYGFGELQRTSLLRLAEKGIRIEGFLVASAEQADYQKGVSFLGKKIYLLQKLVTDGENFAVLDICGDNEEALSGQNILVKKLLKIPFKEIIIYGAGLEGNRCYQALMPFGIKVLKYCDKNEKKQGNKYNGAEVISPVTLKEKYAGYPVVVALRASLAENVGLDLKNNNIAQNVFIWDKVYLAGKQLMQLFPNSEEYHLGAYLLSRLRREQKKVVLYGKRGQLPKVAVALRSFDFEVLFAVDCDGFSGEIDGLKFADSYDLLYEDVNSLAVIVFREAFGAAQQFIKESGLDEKIFVQSDGGAVFFGYMLDPVLGHNVRFQKDEESYAVLRTRGRAEKPLRKIGILGGSTSDVSVYNDSSWPEELTVLANKHGLNWEIYAGGVSSYNVFNETQKFVRDMSILGLDVLISYSRLNEPGEAEKNKQKILCNHNYYQTYLFKQLAEMKVKSREFRRRMNLTPDFAGDDLICFGPEIKDVAENWLHYEKLMHGMCQELGIKFHAICQPWLFDKSNLTAQEQEVIYCDDWEQGRREQSFGYKNAIRDLVKQQDSTWLHDFTGIFDGRSEEIYFDVCHLTSRGNQLLAEKIFKLIVHDLQEDIR